MHPSQTSHIHPPQLTLNTIIINSFLSSNSNNPLETVVVVVINTTRDHKSTVLRTKQISQTLIPVATMMHQTIKIYYFVPLSADFQISPPWTTTLFPLRLKMAHRNRRPFLLVLTLLTESRLRLHLHQCDLGDLGLSPL